MSRLAARGHSSPGMIRIGWLSRRLTWVAAAALLTALASASNIEGRVVNRTHNRPSAGDDVVLYRVDRSMHEVARAKTDAHGTFRFEGMEDSRYLVAAFHEEVSYHTKVFTGSAPVAIDVYDTAATLPGIHEKSNTLFLEENAGALRVTEFILVSNQSTPAHTLAASNTFKFALPPGAVLESTAVQPPATLPLRTSAVSCGARGQYCINYPIRPGTTKIRAVYQLHYLENVSITPSVLHPVRELAIMVPDSMHLEVNTPGAFENRGQQKNFTMYLATDVRPGRTLGFHLSRNRVARSEPGTLMPADRALQVPGLPGILVPQGSAFERSRSDGLPSRRPASSYATWLAGFTGLALLVAAVARKRATAPPASARCSQS